MENFEKKQSGAFEVAPGIGSEGKVTATTGSISVAGATEPTVADTAPPAPQIPTPETPVETICGTDGFVALNDLEDTQDLDGKVQKDLHAENHPLSPIAPNVDTIEAQVSSDEEKQHAAETPDATEHEPHLNSTETETQESNGTPMANDEAPLKPPSTLLVMGWPIASRLIAGQFVVTYEGFTNDDKRFIAYWVCHTDDYQYDEDCSREELNKPLPFSYGTLTEFYLDLTRNSDPALGEAGFYVCSDLHVTPLTSEETDALPPVHGPLHPFHTGSFKSYWYNGKKRFCFVLRPELVVVVDAASLQCKGCVRPIQGLRYRFRLAQGECASSPPLVCSLKLEPEYLHDRLVLSRQWYNTWQEHRPNARTITVGELFMGDVPQTAISHFLRCEPREIKAADLLKVAVQHAEWVVKIAGEEWERSEQGKGKVEDNFHEPTATQRVVRAREVLSWIDGARNGGPPVELLVNPKFFGLKTWQAIANSSLSLHFPDGISPHIPPCGIDHGDGWSHTVFGFPPLESNFFGVRGDSNSG